MSSPAITRCTRMYSTLLVQDARHVNRQVSFLHFSLGQCIFSEFNIRIVRLGYFVFGSELVLFCHVCLKIEVFFNIFQNSNNHKTRLQKCRHLSFEYFSFAIWRILRPL